MKGRIRSMRIRPIALCLGLGITPSLALTAHAGYTVTPLQNEGGAVSLPYAISETNASALSVGYSQTASGGSDAVLWASGVATMLQDYGGQGFDVANAINATGWSVGTSATVSGIGEHAVLWSPSGAATPLVDVGGERFSDPLAINATEWSVGFSDTANGYEAVLWQPSGKALVLQNLTSAHQSDAFAINASEQSVGYSATAKGQAAVLWSSSGIATVLADPGGAHNSAAVAINAKGYSVGYSETASGGYEAVRWSPTTGKATVLHDLGGQGYSQALAENNNGQIIGFSKTMKGEDAVLWSLSPTTGKWIATMLADPGREGFEYAVAINASGQSVGYADIPGGGTEAVLWQPSGKATNLGASAILGSAWSNTQATGINNNGDIIGFGDYKGEIQGFLLTPAAASVSAIPFSATPVPEASTWAMLVVGFGGLGFAAYRRKQNNRCI